MVFLAPTDLVAGEPESEGVIVRRLEPDSGRDDCDLPGAEMPPLGSTVPYAEQDRVVWGIDPVGRTVTLIVGEDHVTLAADDPEGPMPGETG